MGDRREGFGSGVAFVAVQTNDHGAVTLDVAGELGGGVTGFVETVGRGVVVEACVRIVKTNGVGVWSSSYRYT